MSQPTTQSTTAIDDLVSGMESASIPPDVFTEDAVLDATVPNWRFSVHGGAAVRDQLGGWYADPGRFRSVSRTPLPDGELVEFTLDWEEGGVAHACHQAHILRVRDGKIAADTAFCGGRWPAPLLAEMAAAAAR
jgi:hypothetical protein